MEWSRLKEVGVVKPLKHRHFVGHAQYLHEGLFQSLEHSSIHRAYQLVSSEIPSLKWDLLDCNRQQDQLCFKPNSLTCFILRVKLRQCHTTRLPELIKTCLIGLECQYISLSPPKEANFSHWKTGLVCTTVSNSLRKKYNLNYCMLGLIF